MALTVRAQFELNFGGKLRKVYDFTKFIQRGRVLALTDQRLVRWKLIHWTRPHMASSGKQNFTKNFSVKCGLPPRIAVSSMNV